MSEMPPLGGDPDISIRLGQPGDRVVPALESPSTPWLVGCVPIEPAKELPLLLDESSTHAMGGFS